MSSSTSDVLDSSISKLKNRSSSIDDEICDDWEQLDQQVNHFNKLSNNFNI